jgi:uncharacterized protein (TIGR02444 family)
VPEFWPFSLTTYRRSGVERACLQRQDDLGLDVNCLLFCCWAARAGYGRLEGTEVGALVQLSRDWNEPIVKPLREVRRALKDRVGPAAEGPVAALRQAVKDVELEAEWHEQRMLAGLLVREPSLPASREAADANFDAYLQALKCPREPAAALLRVLVDAAFVNETSTSPS